ncbi:MAG: transcription antiterminator [Bacillota bacterium]|nr:MAG: transcription antiterminator [Bacillota bacterium]
MAETARHLGTRSKHLLLTLLQKDGPVVIATLARQFGVSPRSIRYDLDEIEEWLGAGPVKLRRRPRVGIWVEGAPEDFVSTRETLGMVEDYRPILSPEQRRNIIVARLLQRDEPVTSHALADELDVSRTTVFADLDNVQEWLGRRGLTLVRRSNYGLRVVGEESAWRQAVSDVLNEFAESGELGQLLMQVGVWEGAGAEDSPSLRAHPHLLALMGDVDLGKVEAIVRWAESASGVEFTTGSYSSLVFHIAIAVERLNHGKQVELTRDRLAALQSHPEYRLAQQVAVRIADAFDVKVPPSEVGNLCLHFIGARVRGLAPVEAAESPEMFPRFDVEASAVARELLRQAETHLGFPLLTVEGLHEGLALHLRPSLGRLRFGLPVTNPLLDEVRASYPRIYAAGEKVAASVEPIVGLRFPPEEIGHITMHLAAAILRRRQVTAGKRRVVVASTGDVGTDRMLGARLANEFLEIDVIATSSVHGIRSTLKRVTPDFIVSTSDMPGIGVDVIVVAPLLTDEDVVRVRSYLDRTFRPTEERLLAEASAPPSP